MVVFDEHGIVEREAVIGAAARAHGIFFQDTQAWCCFSRAYDLRVMAAYRVLQARPSPLRCHSACIGN
jgi:hypothetical protein